MTLKNRLMSIIIPAALLLGTATLTSACGGCPWIGNSDVTVSPQAGCLSVHIADQSGDAPSTGCVNPVLVGENLCGQPLTLPAEYSTDGQALTVAPDERFVYEVGLEHCDAVGDNYHASIPATLGADSITIEFDLYAP